MIGHNLRDESGMTLIDTLITVAIMGIIIGPITGSLILGLLNSEGATQRVTDSADAQLLSEYWSTDVATAEQVSTTTPSTCGGANTVAQFQWSTPSANPGGTVTLTPQRVAYVRKTVVGAADELWRVSCVGAATPTQNRVIRALGPAAIVIALSCNQATCIGAAASTPDEVKITLTAKNLAGTSDSYTPYTFSITGSRRQS